ncbi:MAG: nickel-dependent lactate racemase [Deltaproteobacteria bacterium]|nr:nickel-dependent lactate racemase [Deltaproteobacteria bacterium]
MEIAIPCGREDLALVLPPRADILEPRHAPVLNDPEEAVAAALRDPVEGPPLADLARGRKTACVVISDITRPVPNRVILSPLLKTLELEGIGRTEITILIATGTHRPNVGQELAALVGEQIAATFRFMNHDCRNPEGYRRIGELEGAPVEINRVYLEADLKILTGLIEPHPYAGYSGGAKSILPGLSSLETMKFMHSFKMIAHPRVTNSVLDGNPFYEATTDVARLAGVDFIVNAMINKDKAPVGFFAGALEGAHRAGCRMANDLSVIRMEKPADLVITSGGGAPMDATFYQCGKGILAAKDICRPGGTVIMVCGCALGIGSDTYAELVKGCSSLEVFERKYSDPQNFVMDQWAVQSYFQALNRIGRVLVYSPGLSAEQLSPFGVQKIDHLQGTVDSLLPESPRVAAMPQGPYVVGLAG